MTTPITSTTIQPAPRRRFPAHEIAALLLVLFSFFMSALVSDRVFERLPHLEDEVAYLFQAKTYAGGHWVIDTPTPRRAYWQPFVLDYEVTVGDSGANPVTESRRFGKYTPGWPLLLAPGILLGQAWVINAFMAALTVATVYRLGSAVYNRDTGLIAALLTAFSPMALLLNASLMAHSSALFFTTVFMYAYWRIERGRNTLRWGLAAGIALGLVVASRPLTGIAVAFPFVVWSAVRLLRALSSERAQFWPRLKPLLVLAAPTVLISLLVPIYNYAATGDPGTNLYTLVWWYDEVGFGECCGRAAERGEGGHNLERGLRQTRFDLSLSAADLYGWQIGDIGPDVVQHYQREGDYYPRTGLSWMLLPFGLLVAFRRKTLWIVGWLLVLFGWVVLAYEYQDGALMRSPTTSYVWLGVAFTWLALPLLFLWRVRKGMWAGQKMTWTWLLFAVMLGLVGVQVTYWIGSQRYSTRYYFEALTAVSLLSALPVAYLARHVSRLAAYGFLGLALVYSLYTYSTPRINTLYGFNNIHPTVLEGIAERRQGDDPVLVLVTGSNVRWRALGVLMAVTSPYLDSDIVGAWDYGGVREDILDRFPDRQVIEMLAADNDAWFADETEG